MSFTNKTISQILKNQVTIMRFMSCAFKHSIPNWSLADEDLETRMQETASLVVKIELEDEEDE